MPRKNVQLLSGRPLIAYTIDAARAAKGVSRVIVSTDDPEIAAEASRAGAEVPFIRPAELATDDVSTDVAARHAIGWLRESEGFSCDGVVILQPTSPLRPASRIDEAIDLLTRTGADSVVSVCAMEHPLEWLRMLDDDGWMRPIPGLPEVKRRQEAMPVYRLNGAVYATWSRILEEGAFPGRRIRGLVMPREESIDIDVAADFVVAEALMRGARA